MYHSGESIVSLEWMIDELDRQRRAHRLRRRRVVRSLPDGCCEIDGRRMRDFASNDYLGLAHHPRLLDAATSAIREFGTGARASALITGRTPLHEALEQRLAEFEGTEAALLFPTGFAANMGTIAALVGPGDEVHCDRLNHASLIDGCRLSGAKFRVYPHNDVDALDRDLSKPRDRKQTLIVTDSLFSMDGDAAPLAELLQVAERHGAWLLVDEAHATGVFGERGRGLTEGLAEDHPRLIKIGTLSKAIGSQGGFVAAARPVVDWLFNSARSQMFSTALAPAACAAALAALDLIETEPQRRTTLHNHAARLRQQFATAGIEISPQAIGPILPIVIGDDEQTLQAAARLESAEFLVAAIRPPTVPQGTSRLRISLSAAHTAEDVDSLATSLGQLLREESAS